MPPDGLLMAGEANWAKARWKGIWMKPFDYESQKLERRGPMCRRKKWFLSGLLL